MARADGMSQQTASHSLNMGRRLAHKCPRGYCRKRKENTFLLLQEDFIGFRLLRYDKDAMAIISWITYIAPLSGKQTRCNYLHRWSSSQNIESVQAHPIKLSPWTVQWWEGGLALPRAFFQLPEDLGEAWHLVFSGMPTSTACQQRLNGLCPSKATFSNTPLSLSIERRFFNVERRYIGVAHPGPEEGRVIEPATLNRPFS